MLTNSVPVAMELAARDEVELQLCGGQVRPGDAACYGAQAVGPAEVEAMVEPTITADEAAERIVAFRSALPLALAGR
jgi:hypothetical protein